MGRSQGVFIGEVDRISSSRNAIVNQEGIRPIHRTEKQPNVGGQINLGPLPPETAGEDVLFTYEGGTFGCCVDARYIDRNYIKGMSSQVESGLNKRSVGILEMIDPGDILSLRNIVQIPEDLPMDAQYLALARIPPAPTEDSPEISQTSVGASAVLIQDSTIQVALPAPVSVEFPGIVDELQPFNIPKDNSDWLRHLAPEWIIDRTDTALPNTEAGGDTWSRPATPETLGITPMTEIGTQTEPESSTGPTNSTRESPPTNLPKLRELRKQAERESSENPEREDVSSSTTTTSRYKRSSAVREYALARAEGTCEVCDNDAPFFKENGDLYLEVHHVNELSEGGADDPSIVGAVCPSCHKEIHYGEDGDELNEKLRERLQDGLGDIGVVDK